MSQTYIVNFAVLQSWDSKAMPIIVQQKFKTCQTKEALEPSIIGGQ
jgi:hypothetical protein